MQVGGPILGYEDGSKIYAYKKEGRFYLGPDGHR